MTIGAGGVKVELYLHLLIPPIYRSLSSFPQPSAFFVNKIIDDQIVKRITETRLTRAVQFLSYIPLYHFVSIPPMLLRILVRTCPISFKFTKSTSQLTSAYLDGESSELARFQDSFIKF